MSKSDQSLTVHLIGIRAGIDATAFIEVLKDTLTALAEINKQISPYGAASVQWEVVAAGMSSPLYATLRPADANGDIAEYGYEAIQSLVLGIQQLDGRDDCPRRFNEAALRAVSAITRTAARGVSRVEFSNNGTKAVATKTVSENASKAVQRLQLETAQKSGDVLEYGTIEGHLKELSEMSDKDKMVIVDDLTGTSVSCFFRRAEVERMGRIAWKHRVSVIGKITIDRITGHPKSVLVDDVTVMRGQEELPQIEDLNGIDITGGVESSEYVRGLRDDD